MLEISQGNAVSGASRFDRPKLHARLMRLLKSSSGIKMFGLRRIGKSTLKLYVIEQLEKNNAPYIYVDAQGVHSLADFLLRLQIEMPGEDNFMSRMRDMITSEPALVVWDALAEGTVKKNAQLAAYWRFVSSAMNKALKGETKKPVLIIDEFSYLIVNLIKDNPEQGKKDVENLLASLREWRGEGMKMLLTGSIGFAGLARKYNLSQDHLNDLIPFSEPELNDEEANDFIDQSTEDFDNWKDAHKEVLLKEVGVYYPIFLVSGLLEIDREEPAAPDEIPEIFATQIRPHLHNDFYSQFGRRFKEYAQLDEDGEEQKKLMLPVLKQIMETKTVIEHSDIECGSPYSQLELSMALEIMADDGFITFSENAEGERSWKCANRLARLWWKRAKLT